MALRFKDYIHFMIQATELKIVLQGTVSRMIREIVAFSYYKIRNSILLCIGN